MMDDLYFYLLSGSIVLIPILLLLILLNQQRCRAWSKKCANKLDTLCDEVESIKYSAEAALTRYLSDYIPEKIHSLVSDMEETQIREKSSLSDIREEDVEVVLTDEKPQVQSLKPFDINDFPKMDPVLGEKCCTAIMEALALEHGYSAKYIKRPDVNFNGMGMKRVSLSPEHWSKLTSLGFVNETPVSVSAIVFNILVEHFSTHGKEIEKLVIIGDRNMRYGYGRY